MTVDAAHTRAFVEERLSKIADLSPLEAKDLEIGIFNATIDYAAANRIPLSWQSDVFMEAYLAKARSVLGNLKSDTYIGNTSLITRLAGKEFMPHDIPLITRESIHPELWGPIIEKERLRSREAYEFRQASMTDHIKCITCLKKGWKSKITYYELQTRSADEPMTLMIKCHTCGHRWKN